MFERSAYCNLKFSFRHSHVRFSQPSPLVFFLLFRARKDSFSVVGVLRTHALRALLPQLVFSSPKKQEKREEKEVEERNVDGMTFNFARRQQQIDTTLTHKFARTRALRALVLAKSVETRSPDCRNLSCLRRPGLGVPGVATNIKSVEHLLGSSLLKRPVPHGRFV